MGQRKRAIGVVQAYVRHRNEHAVQVGGQWYGIPRSLIFAKGTKMLPGEYLAFEYEDTTEFGHEITRIFLRTPTIEGYDPVIDDHARAQRNPPRVAGREHEVQRLEVLKVAGAITAGHTYDLPIGAVLEEERVQALSDATTQLADKLLKWVQQ